MSLDQQRRIRGIGNADTKICSHLRRCGAGCQQSSLDHDRAATLRSDPGDATGIGDDGGSAGVGDHFAIQPHQLCSQIVDQGWQIDPTLTRIPDGS
jgi:hypothetical protein